MKRIVLFPFALIFAAALLAAKLCCYWFLILSVLALISSPFWIRDLMRNEGMELLGGFFLLAVILGVIVAIWIILRIIRWLERVFNVHYEISLLTLLAILLVILWPLLLPLWFFWFLTRDTTGGGNRGGGGWAEPGRSTETLGGFFTPGARVYTSWSEQVVSDPLGRKLGTISGRDLLTGERTIRDASGHVVGKVSADVPDIPDGSFVDREGFLRDNRGCIIGRITSPRDGKTEVKRW